MKKTQKNNKQRYERGHISQFRRGVMNSTARKHPAHIRYLVVEILATCKDAQSSRFYSKVAQMLPEHMIFRYLAEIRQDPTIRNRGAVFATKVKRYLERHARQDGGS